jgi:hypothetical protein
MIKVSESFSKKGFGNGFISKAERFKDEHFLTLPAMPGPGAYVTSTHSESLLGDHIYSPYRISDKYKFKNQSPVFVPHISSSLVKQTITPGPGSY